MSLDRALSVIEGGMRAKTHVGAQLFVARDDQTLADLGVGFAAAAIIRARALAEPLERGRIDAPTRAR